MAVVVREVKTDMPAAINYRRQPTQLTSSVILPVRPRSSNVRDYSLPNRCIIYTTNYKLNFKVQLSESKDWKHKLPARE